MTSVRIPLVGYYALLGTATLFSLLTWILAWAAVGRISSARDYFYFDGNDNAALAFAVLMAILAMTINAFCAYEITLIVLKRNTFGPFTVKHWRTLTLITLTAILFPLIILCGALSGVSYWINAGVVGAYIAFAVLTFIVNVLWILTYMFADITSSTTSNNTAVPKTTDVEANNGVGGAVGQTTETTQPQTTTAASFAAPTDAVASPAPAPATAPSQSLTQDPERA